MVAIAKQLSIPNAQRSGKKRSLTLRESDLSPLDLCGPAKDELFADRPVVRPNCKRSERPCPWVGCKHHLYLDVHPATGSMQFNFPDIAPDQLHLMPATCALDVADQGGLSLEEVGEIMQLTCERIRQVEVRGLLKLKLASPATRRSAPIGGRARVEGMTVLHEHLGRAHEENESDA